MQYISLILVLAVFGYFLGSIPAGYIAGRIAGIDIRTVGSGNVGATNVVRTLGKKFGYPVFLFDLAKGLVAVFGGASFAHHFGSLLSPDVAGIVAGTAAVIGHSFPIWLGFRGGKGVATSLGVFLGLMPLAAAAILVTWILIFVATRYVSVASLGAAVALPLVAGLVVYRARNDERALFYFALLISALVIWRHRSNIVRLWQGTEPRFQRK